MQTAKGTNLAVRFLLELASLAAFAYAGARAVDGLPLSILLAIAIPAVAAVVWGLLVSPKAPIRLPEWLRLTVQLIFFGGAALALALANQQPLAWAYAVAAVVNTTLYYAWGQYGRDGDLRR